MTTTGQRRLSIPHRSASTRPLLARLAAAGCSTLLAATALTAPAAATATAPMAATGTESPSPGASSSTSPAPAVALNQAPQLTCGGVMTQNGSIESIRVSVTDPDGDPVTLSAGVSMFGVQPTVSGHVITYPAPSSATGQDNFAVIASDGQGGEAHCEIGVLVQPGSTSPTPTPTPTEPSPSPSTPAPAPTTAAPTPTPVPQPTGDAPTPGGSPTPTPTSRPTSPAPTTAPVAPGAGSDDETVTSPGTTTPTPGTGRGDESAAGTPGSTDGTGATSGGVDGTAGTNGTNGTSGTNGGADGTGGGPDGDAPATDTGSATGPDDRSPVAPPPPLRPGPGADTGAPDPERSGAAEDRDVEADEVRVDRTADTGASGWLFGGVGVLMIALVGLALMALPRGRRQH
jgi:hypothetical protein